MAKATTKTAPTVRSTGNGEETASGEGRTITAKRTNGATASVTYNFGKDLDEMIDLFGEDVVFNHAKGSLVVALQGWMRGQLDNEKTEKEIRATVKDWKPGVRKQGKAPIDKMRDALSKLSPEEKAALLKEFHAK